MLSSLLAAERRMLLSCVTSGSVHLVVVGSAWLGIQAGWFPTPYALPASPNSIALVASMASNESPPTTLCAEIILPADVAESLTPIKPPPAVKELPLVEALEYVSSDLNPQLPTKTQPIESVESDVTSNAPAILTRKQRSENLTSNASAASAASQPRRGAEFDILPTPIYNPQPLYPSSALLERREGQVVLRVKIRNDGSVETVKVYRSSGYTPFDEAALTAVANWKFQPGKLGGENSSGEIAVPIRFRIAEAP